MTTSLRVRVAGVIASVCVIALAALGGLLYYASEELEAALVGQMLREELQFLVKHQSSATDLPPSRANIQYFVARNAAEAARLPPYIRDLPPGIHEEVEIGDGQERDVAVHVDGAVRLAVVYDIGPYEDREREFRRLAWLTLFVVGLLSLPLGYYVAGRLTRQLTDLADRAGALPVEATGSSFHEHGQDAEVATLAQALDGYQRRVLELLRREKTFTADVSHELRTPLTAIRTSCELLAVDRTLSSAAQERIGYIRHAVEQMEQQVQALLMLAREESNSAEALQEVLDVRECVDDASRPMQPAVQRKGLDLQIDVPQAATLQANRQALGFVLSNLLSNAIRHTDAGYVRIAYEDGRLTVRDSGTGISPAHLSRIFGRHYRVEEGTGKGLPGPADVSGERHGIGLDIVRRVCDHAGWRVDVTSAPGAGSSFTVRFGSTAEEK